MSLHCINRMLLAAAQFPAAPTSPAPHTADGSEVPMTALGGKLLAVEDPEARCLPTGTPRRDPYPSKILPMPKPVHGDSIGHWEGDQLAVDTVGFNGKTWLDLAGHPSSDQLHVIERYSRPDLGHLKWEITIEDPVMYTRPWRVTRITPLLGTENERDSRHLDAIDAIQKGDALRKAREKAA